MIIMCIKEEAMKLLIELYFMELDAFLEVYDDYATLVLLKRNDENDYDTEEHFDITLSLEDAEKIKSILCGWEER